MQILVVWHIDFSNVRIRRNNDGRVGRLCATGGSDERVVHGRIHWTGDEFHGHARSARVVEGGVWHYGEGRGHEAGEEQEGDDVEWEGQRRKGLLERGEKVRHGRIHKDTVKFKETNYIIILHSVRK